MVSKGQILCSVYFNISSHFVYITIQLVTVASIRSSQFVRGAGFVDSSFAFFFLVHFTFLLSLFLWIGRICIFLKLFWVRFTHWVLKSMFWFSPGGANCFTCHHWLVMSCVDDYLRISFILKCLFS